MDIGGNDGRRGFELRTRRKEYWDRFGAGIGNASADLPPSGLQVCPIVCPPLVEKCCPPLLVVAFERAGTHCKFTRMGSSEQGWYTHRKSLILREWTIRNQQVAGSIPAGGSMFSVTY